MGILAYLWRRRFGPDGPAYRGWRRRYRRCYDLDDSAVWCPSMACTIVDGMRGYAHDLRHLHFRHDPFGCVCVDCGHCAVLHHRGRWLWALRTFGCAIRRGPRLGCDGSHGHTGRECHVFRCDRRTRLKWSWGDLTAGGARPGPAVPR